MTLTLTIIARNHRIFAFCTAIHSFVTAEPRDFKFGILIYHSKSHPADEKSSLKAAWSRSADPPLNFTPRVISPQRLKLETSNFVHGSAMQEGCYRFRCLVNRGTIGVNSLPRTVARQLRDYDLNPGPSVPEFSKLTTRLPSHSVTEILVLVIIGRIACRATTESPTSSILCLFAPKWLFILWYNG